jgi:hypothetical protein
MFITILAGTLSVLPYAYATEVGVVGLASVQVTTLAGGGGTKCNQPGYRDGLASQSLFNLPARVQVVKKRLFVLDNHNGCIRSFPVGVSPADTFVRSETGCGGNSTLAYLGPDAKYPNGTSRGWPWVDGPLDFWVSSDATKVWVVDTYNNKVKVATKLGGGGSFGPWKDLAGSGAVGFTDGVAAKASFYQPHGLAVAESRGYAYVSDTFASCIRSISLATGEVKTIAGTCGEGKDVIHTLLLTPVLCVCVWGGGGGVVVCTNSVREAAGVAECSLNICWRHYHCQCAYLACSSMPR